MILLLPVAAALLAQGPAPSSVTLGDAMRLGIAARGRTAEARAALAEARAERKLAGQVPNPTISFERTTDVPHQHLVFDQSLSWLATRGSARAAAAAGIRRAQADSVELLASIGREVREAFYGLLGARELERLVTAQAGATDSLALLAGRRLQAGDISRFEFEQTDQEARRNRLLISSAHETSLAAGAAFGRAIGATGSVPDPQGTLEEGLGVLPDAAAPVDSLPMVAGAVADSAALALELRTVQRGRIPVPSLTAGAEWGDPDLAGQSLSVIGFSLPLPLWNLGGGDAALARARAERGAALAREARLEGARALSEAGARLAETARRARFGRDSLLPGARALRDRALAAYRAGETSLLNVLDALRSEREIVQSQIENLMAFQAALAAWYALLGRTP